MTSLALRNLLERKTRFLLSVTGVALSIALILILNGFLSGVYSQVTAYLDNTPVDWIVAQDGIANMLGATSLLPPNSESVMNALPGIDLVTPIITRFIILDLHGAKVVVYMIGFDEKLGGGPWELVSGRTPRDKDEVVLDWIMANEHEIALGETITILERDFRVVGLSKNTSSWMASYFFVQKESAEELLQAPGATSFYLLTQQPGVDLSQNEAFLRRRLEGYEIHPAGEIRQNDIDLLVRIFAVPMQTMVWISFAVGTAILGMIVYSATLSKEREYGVLKAVGATNHALFALVATQALVIAILGIVSGIGLAVLAADWIPALYPKFAIVLSTRTTWLVSLFGIAMGLLSALTPAVYLSRLDPAQVFRK